MSDQLHVGYILKQYPRLSETFILNEILGVEEVGAHVTVFSLRHATEGRFHPNLASVRGDVHYLPDVDKAAFLSALRALPDLNTDQLAEVLDFVDLLPPERRARILLHAIEVADRVRVSRIDHLHAHFLTVAAQTAHIVHLLTGVPYTVTAHAKDIYRHTVDWNLAQRIARHATAVITVCDANLEHLVPRLGRDVTVRRIYNGLGPQQPPVRLAERTRHLVVGVGRLVEKKGFDVLLHAVALLADDLPDLRCVLVGDGDQRHALETLSYQLGIADRVCFTGSLPQPDVEKWLRRAHVMAAPCRVGDDGNQDALPTVLLEALGAGVPTIATPIAGIPEIIEHNVEGLVVPADDVGALAAGCAALMIDDVRWAELSSAGPKKLAKRFDRVATVRDLMAVFDSASTTAARMPIGLAG